MNDAPTPLPAPGPEGPEKDPFTVIPVPFYKNSVALRLIGFLVLALSLVIMFGCQRGWLPPFFRMVSYGVAGVGMAVYLAGRILTFWERKRK